MRHRLFMIVATSLIAANTFAATTSSSVGASIGGSGDSDRCDIDGDGYGDLVIGAPGESVGAIGGAGAFHVIYGSASGPSVTGDQAFSQETHGVGGVAEVGDFLGVVTVCADLDGDGFADVVVGAPYEDIGVKVNAGSIHIMYGSHGGLSTGSAAARSVAWHQDTPGVKGVAEASDGFGNALAIGDFNGDGNPDLAVGVSGEAIGSVAGAGAVHLFVGTSSGPSVVGNSALHQARPGVRGAVEEDDRFGSNLAVGDFDADGYADLAIGVPFEDIGSLIDAGAVQIIPGGPSGLSVAGDYSIHQNSPGFAGGSEPGDRFGDFTTTGDFDGDGFDDLAVGVPFEDIGPVTDAGATQVVYGSRAGLTGARDVAYHQDTPGVRGVVEPGDRFGGKLVAGDFDANGRDDLAISSPFEDVGSVVDAGTVHLLLGSSAGLRVGGDLLFSQDTDGIPGVAEAFDQFGQHLLSSDISGDGAADLVVGAPREDLGGIIDAGAIYVAPGVAGSGLDLADTTVMHQNTGGIVGVAEDFDGFGWQGPSAILDASGAGAVRGYKFDDRNADGEPGDAEPPSLDVSFVVSGASAAFDQLAVRFETASDVAGEFTFANLLPGTYTVVELVPFGWASSTHDVLEPSVTLSLAAGEDVVALPGQAVHG